uniref:KAP family P-loop domain-containing protein n=1 Tax=Candidatus Kentrum sp. SD TaxID=2126332 RepID=A0A451BPY4_9GAMM|nr:MAG: KAP family P-loop domain-containing protein [Candidatus Kentron sp. SD]
MFAAEIEKTTLPGNPPRRGVMFGIYAMPSKSPSNPPPDNHHEETPIYRNDLWTLDDDFALGRAGDQVARMALEVAPPFTLGVTGKWGAGKTSVMRRAFATLGGQPIRQERALTEPGEEGRSEEWENLACANEQRKSQLGWPDKYFDAAGGVFCVWFSPWQHQNEENPLIPLLREIQAQFQAQLKDRFDWWQKLPEKSKNSREKAWGQCRSAGFAGIKLLEHAIDATLSLAAGRSVFAMRGASDAVRQGWQEGKNKDKDNRLLEPGDGQRFHLLFEDAIDQVLDALLGFPRENPGNKKKKDPPENASPRLILFIDDLDRCEESTIVRLLEGIKLYLASRRCVFVLGIDDSAVLDTLARYWKGRSQDSNREYLEKLFQAVLAVPLPATARVREAIAEQLRSHQIPDAERLAKDIEQLLEPNPRKIKNFVNGFCATWRLHNIEAWLQEKAGSKVSHSGAFSPEEEGERAVRRFLIFHYLRLYHRPIWRLLERQPWSLAILRAVIGGGSGIESSLLPEGIDSDQQRLLGEFYFRAFSHVLAHPAGEKNLDEEREKGKIWHGSESLDEAVKQFQDRQDRKRSDEYLCRLFLELISEEEHELDKRYLCLDVDGAS